ncbi:restriction endonuclease subunit S [Anaerostipes hadrus]|nr:restriction endonuclease subunit S [Anaerostipes hadrus]NSH20808.1 restriction endonuclease subunit S [Anaerostipes hadrus]
MSKLISSTLEQICLHEKRAIISGPFGSNISSKFFVESGIPVIRGNNLSLDYDKFFDDHFVFVTPQKADELKCYAYRNDLIFTAAGTIGQVGVIPENSRYTKYVISNKQIRARIDTKKIDLLYAYYWFSSPWIRAFLIRNNKGSTVPLFTLSEIKDLPIIYPESIDEQKTIISVIDNISKKIEINKKINDYLEEMANTIYDYWFVQFDFPDENGRPYKSSGGEMTFCKELNQNIPQNWGYTSVGNITVCFDSDRIPLSNHQRQEMKGTIPYYGATGIMDYVNCAIFSGDFVLLAEDGSVMDDNGNPILQRISGDVWINNHTHVLQPVNGYSCRLLYLLLKDIPVSMIKTGSIQMKINQANLNSYNILNIPDGIRSRFINQIEPIDTKIIQIQKENDNLKQIRNWLLPMLMNGQATIED